MAKELYFTTVENTTPLNGFKRGDKVRLYKEETSIEYPCLILSCEKLELYRAEVLKGFLRGKSLLPAGDVYTLYLNISGQLVKLGEIEKTRLKPVLTSSVFSTFEKKAYLDKDTVIEGDMLFALCVASTAGLIPY